MRSANHKYLWVVMFVFLLSFVGSASALIVNGFMDIKWGTDIRRFPGVDWNGLDVAWDSELQYPSTKRLIKLSRVHEITDTEGFPVDKVDYHFLDRKFSGFTIFFAEDAWIEFSKYHDYLLKHFGEPSYVSEDTGVWTWLEDNGGRVYAQFYPGKDIRMALEVLSPQEAKYRGINK